MRYYWKHWFGRSLVKVWPKRYYRQVGGQKQMKMYYEICEWPLTLEVHQTNRNRISCDINVVFRGQGYDDVSYRISKKYL